MTTDHTKAAFLEAIRHPNYDQPARESQACVKADHAACRGVAVSWGGTAFPCSCACHDDGTLNA